MTYSLDLFNLVESRSCKVDERKVLSTMKLNLRFFTAEASSKSSISTCVMSLVVLPPGN
jgi:hypothetical protein